MAFDNNVVKKWFILFQFNHQIIMIGWSVLQKIIVTIKWLWLVENYFYNILIQIEMKIHYLATTVRAIAIKILKMSNLHHFLKIQVCSFSFHSYC